MVALVLGTQAPATQRGAFGENSTALVQNGFSPIPILTGAKRPALAGWSTLCDKPLTSGEADHYAGCGLGVACGFNGLVAIDIDTDDPELITAIRKVIPASPVGKRGKRGFTLFFASAGDIPNRKLKHKNGSVIVDILSQGRQTVIPPTLHPETKAAYQWLARKTLLTMTVSGLPLLSLEHIDALEIALKPWIPEPKPDAIYACLQQLPRGADIDDSYRKRVEPWGRTKLAERCRELAVMGRGGRNEAAFKLACAMGRFGHHGIIPFDKIQADILAACEANGLVKEDGRKAVLNSIQSGLRRARNDGLPVLEDRPLPPSGAPSMQKPPPRRKSSRLAHYSPCILKSQNSSFRGYFRKAPG